jgi:hypothetical protein
LKGGATVALALTLALATAAPRPARADDPPIKRMAFAEKSGRLVVSTVFTELFDERAYKKLATGVPSIVVVRAFVYRKGQSAPVSFALATFYVVYNLWDAAYEVRVVDARGITDRRFESRAEALRAVTEVVELPLTGLERIPIGVHHHLDLVIELNPLSHEALAEMRRWLTRPAGSPGLEGDSSFFGTVVSVFANPRLQPADRALKQRSQPFYRVER